MNEWGDRHRQACEPLIGLAAVPGLLFDCSAFVSSMGSLERLPLLAIWN
jgi:hypothetical protein